MKKLVLNLFLFLVINLVLASIFIWLTNREYHYNNANTESVLFNLPKKQSFDFVVMGSSHGRIFSAAQNHDRVSGLLGQKFLNLSKTAAGLVPEKLFLDQFYANGNFTPTIVYFIDPAIFYSDTWNENNYFLEDEPLQGNFLWRVLNSNLNSGVVLNYVRSKFSWFWLTNRKPLTATVDDNRLNQIDPAKVQKRRVFLYQNGLDNKVFNQYTKTADAIIALAENHHSQVVFVLPTTLLGPLPGQATLTNYLQARVKTGSGTVRFVDASNVITDPALYTDHDHLNSAGVELFTRKILFPLLASTSTTSTK